MFLVSCNKKVWVLKLCLVLIQLMPELIQPLIGRQTQANEALDCQWMANNNNNNCIRSQKTFTVNSIRMDVFYNFSKKKKKTCALPGWIMIALQRSPRWHDGILPNNKKTESQSVVSCITCFIILCDTVDAGR